MLQALRDPLWQFIGALLAAIAICISIVAYYRQRQRKSLGYRILTDTPVLTVNEEIRGKLSVAYEGTQVKNVQLLLVKLINTGTLPITATDYERPLCMTFGDDSRILSQEIVESAPLELSPRIDTDQNALSLAPLLLNPTDYIMFKVLVSNYAGAVSVVGRVVGVKAITEIKQRRLKQLAQGAALIALGFSSGLLSSFGVSVRSFLLSLTGVAIIIAVITLLYTTRSNRATRRASSGSDV